MNALELALRDAVEAARIELRLALVRVYQTGGDDEKDGVVLWWRRRIARWRAALGDSAEVIADEHDQDKVRAMLVASHPEHG
jgi:hypothetical protein